MICFAGMTEFAERIQKARAAAAVVAQPHEPEVVVTTATVTLIAEIAQTVAPTVAAQPVVPEVVAPVEVPQVQPVVEAPVTEAIEVPAAPVAIHTPYFDAFYKKAFDAFTAGIVMPWLPTMLNGQLRAVTTTVNGHSVTITERDGMFYSTAPVSLVLSGLVPGNGVPTQDDQLSGIFGPGIGQSALHTSINAILKDFSAPDAKVTEVEEQVSMSREMLPYISQRFLKLWEEAPSTSEDPTVAIRDSVGACRALYLDVSLGGVQVVEMSPNNPAVLRYVASEGLVASDWVKAAEGPVTPELFELFFGDEYGQKKNLSIVVRERLADAERRFNKVE